jgi:hypothetical protein
MAHVHKTTVLFATQIWCGNLKSQGQLLDANKEVDQDITAEKTKQIYAPKSKTNTFVRTLAELKIFGNRIKETKSISPRNWELTKIGQILLGFSRTCIYSFCRAI